MNLWVWILELCIKIWGILIGSSGDLCNTHMGFKIPHGIHPQAGGKSLPFYKSLPVFVIYCWNTILSADIKHLIMALNCSLHDCSCHEAHFSLDLTQWFIFFGTTYIQIFSLFNFYFYKLTSKEEVWIYLPYTIYILNIVMSNSGLIRHVLLLKQLSSFKLVIFPIFSYNI